MEVIPVLQGSQGGDPRSLEEDTVLMSLSDTVLISLSDTVLMSLSLRELTELKSPSLRDENSRRVSRESLTVATSRPPRHASLASSLRPVSSRGDVSLRTP